MLLERVGQTRIHEDFELVLVQDEQLVRESCFLAWIQAVNLLQIVSNAGLYLVIWQFVLFSDLVACILVKVLPQLKILERLFAAGAENFDNFEDLAHLVVDWFWLIFCLARGLWALPHHLRVYAPLTVQVVALHTLQSRCWFHRLQLAWSHKVVAQATHEEIEAQLHFGARADHALLWMQHTKLNLQVLLWGFGWRQHFIVYINTFL